MTTKISVQPSSEWRILINHQIQEAANIVNHEGSFAKSVAYFSSIVELGFREQDQMIQSEFLFLKIIAACDPAQIAESLKYFKFSYIIAYNGFRRLDKLGFYDNGEGDAKLRTLSEDLKSLKNLINVCQKSYLQLIAENNSNTNLKSLEAMANLGVSLKNTLLRIELNLSELDRSEILKFAKPNAHPCNGPLFSLSISLNAGRALNSNVIWMNAFQFLNIKISDFCRVISSGGLQGQWKISELDLEIIIMHEQLFNQFDLSKCRLNEESCSYVGEENQESFLKMIIASRKFLQSILGANRIRVELETINIQAQPNLIKNVSQTSNKSLKKEGSRRTHAAKPPANKKELDTKPNQASSKYSTYEILIETVTGLKARKAGDPKWKDIDGKVQVFGILALSLLNMTDGNISFSHKEYVNLIDNRIEIRQAWHNYKVAIKQALPKLEIKSISGSSTVFGLVFKKQIPDTLIKKAIDKNPQRIP